MSLHTLGEPDTLNPDLISSTEILKKIIIFFLN